MKDINLDINKTTMGLNHFADTGDLLLKMISNSHTTRPLYHDTGLDPDAAPIVFKLNLIPGVSTRYSCAGRDESGKDTPPSYIIETDEPHGDFFLEIRREIRKKLLVMSASHNHADCIILADLIELKVTDWTCYYVNTYYEAQELTLERDVSQAQLFLFNKAFNLVIENYLKTRVISSRNKDIFAYADTIKDRLYLDVTNCRDTLKKMKQMMEIQP